MKENDFEFFLNTASLSILLAKASFAFLLISMFSYWFQATFKYTKNTFFAKIPLLSMYAANVTLASMLFLRWVDSGHFPLSNLYESLLFLSWSLTSIHLFLENLVNKGVTPSEYQVAPTLTLGAITAPLSLFTNAFATFSLPQEMQKVTVLVPALQSNWLIMHVSVMIISYASLLSGSLLAMAFLVIRFVDDNKVSGSIPFSIIPFKRTVNPLVCDSQVEERKLGENRGILETGPEGLARTAGCMKSTPINLNFSTSNIMLRNTYTSFVAKHNVGTTSPEPKQKNHHTFQKNLPQTVDNLSYRSIGLGFALLTIGILSGAVWANEAWGSYWSWDPKETWAFVTWLVFAFYLHTRLSKGWVGKKSAFVATFGFVVIWFCYLGVNLFGKGLHSYGWFHRI